MLAQFLFIYLFILITRRVKQIALFKKGERALKLKMINYIETKMNKYDRLFTFAMFEITEPKKSYSMPNIWQTRSLIIPWAEKEKKY